MNTITKGADHYYYGDACKWTGKVEIHYGRTFYVYEIIEGHQKNQHILSQKKPNSTKEIVN